MAVFINPHGSAELDKVSDQHSPREQQELPAEQRGEVEPSPRTREVTPSRMVCHCHGNIPPPSSGSTSHYENVANSVPSSHAYPPPIVLDLIRRMSGEMGAAHQQCAAQTDRPPPSPASVRHSLPRLDVSSSCLARARLFYEHSPLRHFVPLLMLFLYALLGALLFFLLESDFERQLLAKEQHRMEVLRDRTLQRLEGTLLRGTAPRRSNERWGRSREVLAGYEKELARTKTVPEGTLEWNYLGALFYVGTVFTTIGYGNITPRTTPGQALSIVYAIVGIPLVLAILNQTSKRMTRWLSERWVWYRQRQGTGRRAARRRAEREMEEGEEEAGSAQDGETAEMESRTIPVWLALSLVGGYVCSIAAIFLLWESRWSYFTSFYFICISCLTIGLGDVVPDHPYMLILMFIFVIFGLSCVSMLLSVIQIKMEEWLYRMLMRMQKEYQKALRNVKDPEERERIVAEMLAREPWYMRELAPICISESQRSKLENLVESYEKVMRPTNTKGTQTAGTERTRDVGTGRSEAERARTEEEYVSAEGRFRSAGDQEEDSVSDATSLPMDPASIAHGHPCPSREVQTEIDGGTVAKWEEERRGRKTDGEEKGKEKEHRGTQTRRAETKNQRTDTKGLVRVEQRAADTADLGGTICRSVQTEAAEEGSGRRGAEQRRKVFSNAGREEEIDEEEGQETGEARQHTGTQCSPPPPPLALSDAAIQTESVAGLWSPEDEEASYSGRERSESVAATVGDDDELDDLLNQAYPERAEKKDLVIQTDDSYLRIARRLDRLRTNRTDINVYCTGVNPPKKTAGDRRKSLRFLDNFRHRRQSKTSAAAPRDGQQGAEAEGEAAGTVGGRAGEEGSEARMAENEAGGGQSSGRKSPPASPSQSPLPSAMAPASGRRRAKGHVRMMEDEPNQQRGQEKREADVEDGE